MKKFLFYFVLFSSVYMNAQKTIVEEKFEKDNVPLSYKYLPLKNKIVIEKGKYISISRNRLINKIISYDINGKEEILIENAELMKSSFSITENTFKVEDFEKLTDAKTFRYIVNGKPTPTFKYSNQKRSGFILFGLQYFNDKYEIGLNLDGMKKDSNSKRGSNPLETTELFTRTKKPINTQMPDFQRLYGEAFVQHVEGGGMGFKAKIIDNEKFEIISKSISKDYNTSTLFRTFYNMEGKEIGEKKYIISLPTNYLVYSNNNAAQIRVRQAGNETPLFSSHMAINDFIEDNVTKDIYVFGLFGNKAQDINDDNSPTGYYVFKFDKDGNKVWESINAIDDKDDFNKKRHLVRVFSSLSFHNDALCFETGVEYANTYFHYSNLDKNTGKILTKNKILFEKDRIYTMNGDVRHFLFSFYENKDFKKKLFDLNGLVAIDSNKKVKDYVKNINSKDKIYFNTIFSNEGVWLIESDNENYYKVTFFKA